MKATTGRRAKKHVENFFRHHNIRTSEDCPSCADQLADWLDQRGYIVVPKPKTENGQ